MKDAPDACGSDRFTISSPPPQGKGGRHPPLPPPSLRTFVVLLSSRLLVMLHIPSLSRILFSCISSCSLSHKSLSSTNPQLPPRALLAPDPWRAPSYPISGHSSFLFFPSRNEGNFRKLQEYEIERCSYFCTQIRLVGFFSPITRIFHDLFEDSYFTPFAGFRVFTVSPAEAIGLYIFQKQVCLKRRVCFSCS